MSDVELNLRADYVNDDINMRLFAMRIAEIAAAIALQAGEGVKRPLTKEQLVRAVAVNAEETNLVVEAIWARYQMRHDEGALPPEAYPLKVEVVSNPSPP